MLKIGLLSSCKMFSLLNKKIKLIKSKDSREHNSKTCFCTKNAPTPKRDTLKCI